LGESNIRIDDRKTPKWQSNQKVCEKQQDTRFSGLPSLKRTRLVDRDEKVLTRKRNDLGANCDSKKYY